MPVSEPDHDPDRGSERPRTAYAGSASDTMSQGSNIARVLWRVKAIATVSETPARTRFLTAVRRKSRTKLPGQPPLAQADLQAS